MLKKNILLLFILLLGANAFAQLQDNFDDGDFTNNPAWSGDTSKWQIIDGKLNSNSPIVNDTFYLSTPSSAVLDAEWRIYMELNFQTSSNNLVDIYLISSQENLKSALNGYFVRIGDTKDDISLYRRDGNTVTKLIDGADGRSQLSSANKILLKIKRTAAGLFTLSDDNTGTGNSYVEEGTVTDLTYSSSAYFGISVKQSSSSFFSKHYFDNIYAGPIIYDTSPPDIEKANVVSPEQVDVLFSEPVEVNSAQEVKNYSINKSIGIAVNAIQDIANSALVHIYFANSLQNATDYVLSVDSIRDLSGNLLVHKEVDFTFYQPQKYDVLINEIMADPDPPVGLPTVEWVELFNASAYTIDLSGWSFSDPSTKQTLSDVILQPDSFLILCATASKNLLSPFGKVAGLNSFPSLNNSGDSLTLRDAGGKIISAVNYSDSWYGSTAKKDGGWSLELIDPNNPCGGGNNWKASVDLSGGTPGRRNSVFGSNPDITSPDLLRAIVVDSIHITLLFSETMDSASLAKTSHYSIDNKIGLPVTALPDASGLQVTLQLPVKLKQGTVYHVTVTGVTDCSGNLISNENEATFAIPEPIDSFDIVINEVLFNPLTNGYDYIELYNRSDKVLDLKDLFVASRNDSAILTGTKQVSTGYLFFPGEYAVITQNPDWVQQHYTVLNPKALIKITTLPTMPDAAGNIALLTAGQKVIDELYYKESWQLPLLDSKEGVALERMSFDSPTQDSMNWHSAAASVGFGTPTYKNSQYRDINETSNEIVIDPQVFSPDQDGYNDLAVIQYKFSQPGFVGSFRIYDKEGRLIRDLIKNESLAQSGFFTWDGTTDDGVRAKVGIYIVYAEVFDLSGTVKKLKKTCVLAGKQH